MNKSIEQWDIKKQAVASEGGVVAAQHLLAARAGAGMLASGGNAIDAAVAAAFALAAVEPWMCGLGGSGYMVVWNAQERSGHVLDFQGMLPLAQQYDVVIAGGDTNCWHGPLAISITAFGAMQGNTPWLRRNAQAGDHVLVTGTLGGSILKNQPANRKDNRSHLTDACPARADTGSDQSRPQPRTPGDANGSYHNAHRQPRHRRVDNRKR